MKSARPLAPLFLFLFAVLMPFAQAKSTLHRAAPAPSGPVYLYMSNSGSRSISRYVAGDGEYRWHQARAVLIKNEAGDVVKWVGTYTDITVHKQVEKLQTILLRRESNIAAHLQAALQPELPASAMAVHLAERVIAGVNRAAAGGVMRDDMCLLVAVVENGPPCGN